MKLLDFVLRNLRQAFVSLNKAWHFRFEIIFAIELDLLRLIKLHVFLNYLFYKNLFILPQLLVPLSECAYNDFKLTLSRD